MKYHRCNIHGGFHPKTRKRKSRERLNLVDASLPASQGSFPSDGPLQILRPITRAEGLSAIEVTSAGCPVSVFVQFRMREGRAWKTRFAIVGGCASGRFSSTFRYMYLSKTNLESHKGLDRNRKGDTRNTFPKSRIRDDIGSLNLFLACFGQTISDGVFGLSFSGGICKDFAKANRRFRLAAAYRCLRHRARATE